jgi:VanZ family protein
VASWRGSFSPHSGGTVPDSHRVPFPLADFEGERTMPPVQSKLSLWLPVVVWAGVIFAVSSIPSLSSGLGVWDTVLRKAAHMAEYAVLAALLWRALRSELVGLAAALAYAATDELHQAFVRGRHGSPVDVAIDGIGAAIGLLVVLGVRGLRIVR